MSHRIYARQLIKKLPSNKITNVLDLVKHHISLTNRDIYVLKLLFEYIDSYNGDIITCDDINKIKELLCSRIPRKYDNNKLKAIMERQSRIILILNTYFIVTDSNHRLESKLKEKNISLFDNMSENATHIFNNIDKNNELLRKTIQTRRRINLIFKKIYFSNEIFKNRIDNLTIDRNDLILIIQQIENESKGNIKTRSSIMSNNSISYNTHDTIIAFNMLMKYGIETLKNNKSICSKEIKPMEKKITLTRDYLTDEEQDLLANINKTPLEKLILTLFLTTGLRNNALLNLRVNNLYYCNFIPMKVGSAIEKYGKLRTFIIFEPLKQCLIEYYKAHNNFLLTSECFMFPWMMKPSTVRAMNRGWLGYFLKNIEKKAQLKIHLHPHMLRKTVVSNLMSAGNTLDAVSKFIGHTNTMTTAQHYWVSVNEDIIKAMNLEPLLNFDNSTTSSSSFLYKTNISQTNSTQLANIAKRVAEGIKATMILEKAKEIMSCDQINKFELLWNKEAKEIVADSIKKSLLDIEGIIESTYSMSNSEK